ncbi:Non-ribosomal peptide synthetase [Paraphaeosphaeria sporulosa]
MLGAFYEEVWEFGRQIDASMENTSRPINTSNSNKGKNRRQKMHLPPSEETVRCAEVGDTSATSVGSAMFADQAKFHSSTKADVRNVNEVEITISPQELEINALLDAYFASWIIFLHRYQRDALDQFSWTTSVSSGVHSLSAGGIYFPSLHNVADLLSAARDLRPKFKFTDLATLPIFAFQDGVNDEWKFGVELRLRLGTQHIQVSSSRAGLQQWQASSQLRSFAHIVEIVIQHREYALARLLDPSDNELDSIWSWTTPLAETINKCMHDIISEKSRLQPTKTAVEAWDGNFTYQEVDQYSTELAQHLQLLNNSEDQIIPVLFEKSRWTMVAVLAVMKSGSCFALLDPAQPEGRLSTIVHQTKAKLLVSSKAQAMLAGRVAAGATVVPISRSKFEKIYRPYLEQLPKTSLPPVSPAATMYIQFTSGSTGLPKGCMLSHSNFTSGAIPRAHTVGYKETSRVLDFASYAFDVSIDSMLCTLASGGTLCTPSDERRMNDLSGAMRDMRVNWAGMTPSVVRTLDPDIIPSLATLAVGGEGISISDAASWREKTTVVNCYGPSECTVGATYNNTVGEKSYISMGKGTGCSVWVVDPTDHNKLVPPGVVGELLIEGPIVGYGYLNNPDKTKEVFIENPKFLTSGSPKTTGRRGRMYRTGDLVRYDPDGNGEVIFVGRGDQQVKLRGQRIELAEIEFNMLKHLPGNTRVAAEVIKPGGTGEPTLIAFVTEPKESDQGHLDSDVFATFSTTFQKSLQGMTVQLSKDLPVYMVPSAYIPLWTMPLLVSWKTDRKRLREIGSSVTRQDLRKFSAAISVRSEPKSGMAIRLEKLWARVLGGEADFNASDNFFSMGGDSLRAMKLVAAAREVCIALSVPDIMLNPTLAAMATKAKTMSAKQASEVSAFSLIPKGWSREIAQTEAAQACNTGTDSIEDIYPCTPLQEGLMALSAKFVDAYVAQRVVELSTRAAERLIEAIEMVVQSSPVLRTRVVNVSNHGLFQVVLKDGQLRREHGTYLAEYLEQDREEHMDLGTALFRYGVVSQPGSDMAQVILTCHHAIYDGWSMPLIFERVNRAYKGLQIPRPVGFNHFIKYLTGLDPSASQQYWRHLLDGASPHQFPSLPHKGYITRANSLLEHYVNVPAGANSKYTVATIIRGAWALVSSLYLGHDDIVFGETLTGRSAPVTGIEEIEGPMITTVPIRTKVDHKTQIWKYLDAVHTQTVQQMPHEHFGLQNIRRLSRDAREACELRTGLVLHPKENNVPEATANIEDAPANGFLPSDDAEAAREALKFNTYALMLVCTLDENGFLIMASFDSKCITSPVMDRVLRLLDRVVTGFMKEPEQQLGSVVTLEAEELEDALASRVEDKAQEEKPRAPSNGNSNNQTLTTPDISTPNGAKLQALLSRILAIPETEISPSDSFFDLGGDSISAMKLVSESRAQGLKLSVADVFQSRSLSELAQITSNEKKEKLIQILSRVLEIPKEEISSSDSFFELGGDSISAMRLVGESRAKAISITVPQVFQSRSISELASLAEQLTCSNLEEVTLAPFSALGDDADSYCPDHIQPLLENPDWKIVDVYPTRPLQKVAVDGTVQLPRYSLRYELIKFDASVDEAKLARSCQEVVIRNEVLRTVFVELGNRCLGVVLDSLEAKFQEISVPEDTDIDSSIRTWISMDTEAPKPYGSSFVSFTLFKPAHGYPTLAFRISHAQYDEMCLPILFAQLSALYSDSTVPETLPFTHHVNHVVQQSIPSSIPYWRELLKSSHLSVFRPNIPLTTHASTSIYREFDISSRPPQITIGTLPTAAWAIVVARRLNTRDVVFGEVVTGRNLGVAAADRIVGPSWQYAPFRATFAPQATYREVLHTVQEQHMTSSPHEGMALPEIVEQCTDWDPAEATWFDSVVHQAPRYWVENLNFGRDVKAEFETVYPHAEPLKEWKVQAFVLDGGKRLGIEIVTFEAWREVGEEVVGEIGKVLGCLVGDGAGRVFDGDA